VCRTRHGGHCGYLTTFAAESWINDELVRWFGGAAAE
jgi:predicted alpha/beta-fold hydrolase